MRLLRKINRQESGQMLILASLLLLLSGLIAVPLVSYINTGIKSTMTYQTDTRDIYAADAGVQYAMWNIKYDPNIISDREKNIYGNSYVYPAFAVNNNSVAVSIQYLWLLSGIVEITNGTYPHNTWAGMAVGGQDSLSGDPSQPGTFTMTFTYDESGNKKIAEMGIWLPHGFTYVSGSCSHSIFPNNIDPENPVITTVYGGTSLVWNVKADTGSSAGFTGLNPPLLTQKFWYLPGNDTPIGAASWVEDQSQDIGYSWDNAIWWYNVISIATDSSTQKQTTIKATVLSDSETASGLGLVTYEINPSGQSQTLSIITSAMSGGDMGSAYDQYLMAFGGTPPYTWAISSGSLPPGLTLNSSSGEINGTPTTAGTYNFTAKVMDNAGGTVTQSLSITIYPTLSITTPSTLPNGSTVNAYSQILTASGGNSPYYWSISSGTLPAGLNLDVSTGTITGTPTTAGTYNFTVIVTDNIGSSATQNFVITISN